MKTELRYLVRVGFIVLLVGFTCMGCSGTGQKLEQWRIGAGQKLEQWRADLKKKLNLDDSESLADSRHKNPEVYYIHTTRWSWENLGIVAQWYTGDAGNRQVLKEINPEVNSGKPAAGSEVFIPVKLLRTRKALPKNYAGDSCRKCYRHTVRWPGESMSLIARWYTGAAKNWRKLAAINPRINPNHIQKGNVIVIPSDLLKNKKPLPQKVAARYTPGYFVYTVQQDGEKITRIARWYTGSSANWKVIAKANPQIYPNALMTGNEIFIPSRLLKTRRPLPKSQPAKTAKIPKPQPAAKTKPPEPQKAPTAKTPEPQPAPPAKKPKAQPAAAEKKPVPVEEESIEIFGPKQFPRS